MSEAGRLQFFERCPYPAAVLGRDGRFEDANAAWEGLVGWTPEELVGRPLHELLHPEDVLAARPLGLVGSWTARCLCRDGSALRLSWSVTAGPDGRHFCVARQMEAEERRRQERFRAEFINLAAHALNTPLTPIQLALDTLEVQANGSLGAEAQQTIDIVRRNFRRLRDVVAELLDTARLQGGRMALNLQEAELSALALEVLDALRPAAEEAGVRLRSGVEAGLRAQADAARLRQALMAYLECALACAPPGGEVRLEVGRTGAEAAVTVTAKGADLAPAQLEQLFHPFPSHDDGLAPPRAGTGLGLYMARGIVELHGGWVAPPEARVGDGLSLRFGMPLEGPATAPRSATGAVKPLGAGSAVH